ncbi:MAG: very short patch repair endonuclease [Clostridiales bacterium]|jgi:DNA mismatch endonuclease (patch repair protein)|nr:very short patch repair endonuclease [Clostridiales bacterium]
MADKFDKAKRSSIMAQVHGKNTKPENAARKILHSMGYRFRLHRNDLPGKPDIVLPKYKTVIFVHGCFWHGCPTCRHASVRPKNNAEYWNKKLDLNMERDRLNEAALKQLGWRVVIVWECEIKKSKIDALKTKLKNALSLDHSDS